MFHALGEWRVSEAFHDILWNRRFLVPASQILDGAVLFWHDQIELKKGKASFHHSLTVHGSFENFSDKPRRHR